MTNQKFRRRARLSRVPRKATRWLDTGLNAVLTSGGQLNIDLTANLDPQEKKGSRLLRVIFDFEFNLSVAGSGGLISYGLTHLFAEGATSPPDPDVDTQETNWLWKRINGIVASANANDLSQATFVREDFKPNRLFRTLDSRFSLIIDAGTLSANVNVNGMVRLLIARP